MRWQLTFVWILLVMNVQAQNASIGLDSVSVPASEKYAHPAPAVKFFIGSNYRKEWSAPVTMPVFNLKRSGLKIEKLGGGMQTKSLQLEDKMGREWALRTVDKNAKGALPPRSQNNKLAVGVVQELISASFPYGALIVPALADAIGVPTAHPALYFVPVQNDLGKYDTALGGKVCMLELREPVPNGQATLSTQELLGKVQESARNTVDQPSVLRARLLDMLIADWDRHEDQYKWFAKKEAGANTYYILPKDRDQAFFKSNGWLIRIATVFLMKWVKGFNEDLNNVRYLNYKAQLFDAHFLSELDRNDWQKIAGEVQAAWTDEVIDTAVRQLPEPIYAMRGPELRQKLQGRRNDLVKSALKYYDQLSVVSKIYGTEEADNFLIEDLQEGTHVRVFARGGSKPYFDRTYTHADTKVIELYGFGSNDAFEVRSDGPIKIKIFGGGGQNTYDLQGRSRKIVYDSGTYTKKTVEHAHFRTEKSKN